MILTVGHAVAALALTMAQAPAAERRAGVEVGAKGVKVTVIETTLTKDGPVIRRLFSKTNNTTILALKDGRFRGDVIDNTAKAVAEFHAKAKDEFNVPAERIQVVGSSGVPRAENRPDLVEAIRKLTGKEIRFIDEKEEVALSLLGIVPPAEWGQAILLDVGSGSTKGGFAADGELVYASVPLGSGTYATLVQAERKATKATFAETAEKLRDAKVAAPFRAALSKSPLLAERKRVYLSGGAAWAMVTILHPGRSLDNTVTITASDIDAYLAKVRDANGAIPKVDLSGITDPAAKKKAEEQFLDVSNTFSADNLLAGAEILKALSEAIDLKDRTLVFPRGAFVGWLEAYAAGLKLPPKAVAKVEPKEVVKPKEEAKPATVTKEETKPVEKVEAKPITKAAEQPVAKAEEKPATPKPAEVPLVVVPAAPPVIYRPCPPVVVAPPPVVYYYHCPPPVTVVTYSPCYRPAPVVHVVYQAVPCYQPCAPRRVWCR